MPVNIISQPGLTAGARAAVQREFTALLDRDRIELPALPEHAARVIGLAARPGADALSLARLIASDQPLAARVMKVARAAACQSSAPIRGLQHAIAWLGLGEMADITFTAAVQPLLLGPTAQRSRAARLWQASIAAAIWSREVAAMARRFSEVTYLCGLLHDSGRTLALLCCADVAGKLGLRPTDEEIDALVHEFQAPLGVLLAQRWNLPEAVVACMGHWRDPSAAREFGDEARIVHVAHQVAELVTGQGAEIARHALEADPVLHQLNIGPDRLKALIDRSAWVMGQVHAY